MQRHERGSSAHRSQVGSFAAFAAYGIWGLFPLYFHNLSPASPLEIVEHRIVWTTVLCVVLVLATGRLGALRALAKEPKRLLFSMLAGLLLTANWGMYVWAVAHDRVIDASLGYYINPLMTVGLGVTVLHEPLRRLQRVALIVGAAAVVVLTVGYGQFPYVGLTLATSFSLYSLTKKYVDADAITALVSETALLFPFAAGALIIGAVNATAVFGHHDFGLDLRLLGLGVVTAVPLLLFGIATQRVTMVTLGMLQYITPTGILLLGWLVYDEAMPPARIIGFSLVWIALTLMGADAVQTARASGSAELV